MGSKAAAGIFHIVALDLPMATELRLQQQKNCLAQDPRLLPQNLMKFQQINLALGHHQSVERQEFPDCLNGENLKILVRIEMHLTTLSSLQVAHVTFYHTVL